MLTKAWRMEGRPLGVDDAIARTGTGDASVGRMAHAAAPLHGAPLSAKIVRWCLGVLLGFVALNAFGGGIYGVSGAEGVPVAWLVGTPFRDYFVPSLILFVVVGGALAVAAVLVMRCAPRARGASALAGLVLLGWIVTQVALLGYVSWLQPVVLAFALLILALSRSLPSRTA